ncbi:MAG: FAD:protein FMN transferase, partial [Gammaproteobacteria bacterium]
MREILRRHSFSIAFGLIIFGYIFFFTGQGDVQQLSGFTMGTTYQVQIVDMPENLERAELLAAINSLLARLDRDTFSTYQAQSELSRLNRQPVGVPFAASAELMDVLVLAREISQLS